MSLSGYPVNITDGVYKIFNVAYPNQVADLLYPGGADGTIGGYHDNSDTKRNQWLLENVPTIDIVAGPITLVNQEITTYASVLQIAVNEQLVGNPDTQTVWRVTPSIVADQFFIVNYEFPLTWTLADGNDWTPITVDTIASPPQDNQLWKFVPVN